MSSAAYRYKFNEGVDLLEAESTLHLSILAVEGLFGEARVRMDAAYSVDDTIRALIVDASTEVGQDLNAIFTAFIIREFGTDAFQVRLVEGGGTEGRR